MRVGDPGSQSDHTHGVPASAKGPHILTVVLKSPLEQPQEDKVRRTHFVNGLKWRLYIVPGGESS